ncbi:MAG: class I SAM-dependent rRNA methyltransferase [Granulosicoccaceae bacterium]
MTTLRLKKGEEKRLSSGHLWVFSNEIDTAVTPLKGIEPGQPVTVERANGQFLGFGYANPHSLISARIVSHQSNKPWDAALLCERLSIALGLRERMHEIPYYRWVHSEGDLLPGLVVDRYNDLLVVQINTAGMERFKDDIVKALSKHDNVNHIVFRNDNAIRELEQLPLYRETALGNPPEALVIVENELEFKVPAELGQKTGWFYDHRNSRMALRNWVKGKRVLDLYTYLGAFGLNAATAGAASVLAIDSSEVAVSAANENAAANGLSDVFTAKQDDAVETMRALYTAGELFDVVVLDPPAFIKKRKDRDAGMRHYQLNNRLAMRLLNPGGLLLSASCSQALDMQALQKVIQESKPKLSPGLQILEHHYQAADHPAHLSMPESLYLKGLLVKVL